MLVAQAVNAVPPTQYVVSKALLVTVKPPIQMVQYGLGTIGVATVVMVVVSTKLDDTDENVSVAVVDDSL